MMVELLIHLSSGFSPLPEISLSEIFAPEVDRPACRCRESSEPVRTGCKLLHDHTLSSAGGSARKPVEDDVVSAGGA
jgi:hypothetical protein